ncbi:hypothetical protein H9I32_21275 [Bacillus sp. Xin]|uniref:hypothetical protein n=1 Tax=unclassified Bacillus (in: firmicutes) TaxID=185979 RepID=UPI001573E3D9|nr:MULTISPECIES: hypothetical protein [unclassified Bacillus (in: firmicutes)]MBC6974828.1 hypothetical protein [Bacillus sp. Xin]NSW37068.1 hypothetical protein [Bacillus sp. Xin1]
MSNSIRLLLKQASPYTLVKELIINGKEVSGVGKFVKFDRLSGLAYFSKESNDIFVVICEKIDKIEFVSAAESKPKAKPIRKPVLKPVREPIRKPIPKPILNFKTKSE